MRTLLYSCGLSLLPLFSSLAQKSKPSKPVFNETEVAAQLAKIYEHHLLHGKSHFHLQRLCKDIGGRQAGSSQDSAALHFFAELSQAVQPDSVWFQEVTVPYWERGDIEKVEAQLADGSRLSLAAVSLGFAGPSPEAGLQAQVVEVKSLQELEKLGRQAIQGKIVFFNRPMDATKINTFHAYGGAVDQRGSGPQKAMELGAVACLVRSMTMDLDDVPHTGVTSFSSDTRIPALALGLQSAEKLSALLQENPQTEVFVQANCRNLGPRVSHNLIIEIKGSHYPEQVMVVGGHLDSWDLGEGAHDDGAGCMQAFQVLQTYRELGLKPRHSLRCVLFAAEEIGIYGAKVYAEEAMKDTKYKHIFAIESDAGGHTPVGYTLDALPARLKPAFQRMKQWRPLLLPYGLYLMDPSGSAADVGRLRPTGAVLLGYRPDSQRYFDYHHSAKDRWETVNRRELELGAAAMTSMIYLWDMYGLD